MEAPLGSGKTQCSAEILKAIYGGHAKPHSHVETHSQSEVHSHAEAHSHAQLKGQMYERSLENWWSEYAARKNDEEEEHVADSLLYDERCHLPRSAPQPARAPPVHSVSAPPATGAPKE